MARSIHTTRRDEERAEQDDYSRDEAREATLERQRERLAQKRRIKRYVLDERRQPPSGVTPVATIPVVVAETGEFVHHMATVEDVEAVLRRLPPGVVDGLTRVELHLGAVWMAELEERDPGGGEPDPFVGRLGYERFPGAYSGRLLGSYDSSRGVICLNAHVFHSSTPLREIWAPLLRLEALSTLVHEVGHHYDATMRVARGRWLAKGEERVEIYAEDRQHHWLHSVVVPYLRETYPHDCERLTAWIRLHGGIDLALDAFADDARTYIRGGRVNVNAVVFPMSEAVQQLMRDVLANASMQSKRINFARALHYRDLYDEALGILSSVLSDEPTNTDALTLRADIYVHLRRHAEALEIACAVVSTIPDSVRAWKVIADANEALERWSELRAAANQLLALENEHESQTYWPLVQRMRAALKVGDFDAAREDFATLETSTRPYRQKLLKKLRAELDAAVAGIVPEDI